MSNRSQISNMVSVIVLIYVQVLFFPKMFVLNQFFMLCYGALLHDWQLCCQTRIQQSCAEEETSQTETQELLNFIKPITWGILASLWYNGKRWRPVVHLLKSPFNAAEKQNLSSDFQSSPCSISIRRVCVYLTNAAITHMAWRQFVSLYLLFKHSSF